MAVAIAKFTARVGQGKRIVKGELWDAADPFVVAHPDWFDPDVDAYAKRSVPKRSPVETATAAPGETRKTRRSTTDQ